MNPFNHSQILHTSRTPGFNNTHRILSSFCSLCIVAWLSGCAAPAEQAVNTSVGADSAQPAETGTSDVNEGIADSEQKASSQRLATRLTPPEKPSPAPTVSNELIIADTVINQGNSTPTQNNLTDAGNPALAAAAPDTLREPVLPDNPTSNLEQLQILANSGDVDAQLALGDAYVSGPAVDKSEAHYWYHLAAEQGNYIAQYKLGLQYFRGDGVERDYALAREWWLESATLGSADAQQKLGYLYSEALGVDRDYNRAILWYTRAARLGHAEAQTLLGSLYHEGNRVPRNYAEAFKWYKMAAERGHPHSQYTLATLYHDGFGTEQDFVKCTAWVDVALANGYTDEFNARNECTKHLTESQLDQAAVLANRWKTNYLDQPDYN